MRSPQAENNIKRADHNTHNHKQGRHRGFYSGEFERFARVPVTSPLLWDLTITDTG